MVRALIVLLVLAAVACLALAGDYDGVESYPAVAERRDGGGYSGGGGFGGGFGGGYGSGWGGWRPKFRYINFRIPVPILPRISIGLKSSGWRGW